MDTYPKKRLEIIIEGPRLSLILSMLDDLGVSGYTVFPALSGRGQTGSWSEGMISGANRMVMVLCIANEDAATKVLEAVQPVLGDGTGIICITDAEVLRQDHF